MKGSDDVEDMVIVGRYVVREVIIIGYLINKILI